MRKLSAVAVILIFAAGIMAAQSNQSGSCDRACLEGMVNTYLNAMVAHDASKAPFAKTLKFTEDGVKLPPTEGLWFTSTGLENFKFYVSDPQAGQVGFVGLVDEHEKPVLLALRLKVVNREITEAESVVVRDLRAQSLANLKTAPPAFSEALAPSERVSRQELIRISNLYFDAIEKNDGDIVPWDKDCYRLENGFRTASANPSEPTSSPSDHAPIPGGTTCSGGLSSGILKTIYNIRPRRTPVVDEERGITLGVYNFNHRGVLTVTLKDGSVRNSYAPTPSSMPIVEIFKIKNGKIRDIFAVGTMVPYGMGDGWAGPLYK